MPYIDRASRLHYYEYEDAPIPDSGGELSYVLARIVARFADHHTLCYAVIADIRDALSGTLNEFNICVADPYEADKRGTNGDVWGPLP